MCIRYGAEKICISCLLHPTRASCILFSEVNSKLKSICIKHSFCFAVNENIGRPYLYEDSLHFWHSGKKILARNYITILNN